MSQQEKPTVGAKGLDNDIKSDNCCVLVRNLPNRFDLERNLCDFFIKTSGRIAGIRLEDDGERLAKATIRFEDPKSAQEALRQTSFAGRDITVKLSKCQHSGFEQQWTLYNQQLLGQGIRMPFQQGLGQNGLGQQEMDHDFVGQTPIESFKQWNGIGVEQHDKAMSKKKEGKVSDTLPGHLHDESYYQYQPERKSSLHGASQSFDKTVMNEEKGEIKKSGIDKMDQVGDKTDRRSKDLKDSGEKHKRDKELRESGEKYRHEKIQPSVVEHRSSKDLKDSGEKHKHDKELRESGEKHKHDKLSHRKSGDLKHREKGSDEFGKRDNLDFTHEKTGILKPSVDQLQEKAKDIGISEVHGIKGEYGKQEPALIEKEVFGTRDDKVLERNGHDFNREEHMRSGLTEDEKRDNNKYLTMQEKKESFGDKFSDMKENLKEKASKVTDKILH